MRLPRASAAPLVLAALASATLALRFIDPAEARWLPVCLFHALTGLHCPGCGATRALHLLAQGDLLGALHMNVLVVALIPLLAYATLRRIDLGARPRTIAAAVAIACLFAVARNIPAYPFELLAPSPIETNVTGSSSTTASASGTSLATSLARAPSSEGAP